jgi:hypothetical protein
LTTRPFRMSRHGIMLICLPAAVLEIPNGELSIFLPLPIAVNIS